MPYQAADIPRSIQGLLVYAVEALLGLCSLLAIIVSMVTELLSEVMDIEASLITPADYIEFYGDPFNIVSTSAPKPWKGKGVDRPVRDTEGQAAAGTDNESDWTGFEPPDALRLAPSVTSDILLEIVASSIDIVKARAAEEHRVKRQQSNARRQREEALRLEAERALPKNAEPYLPIIIPSEPETPEQSEGAATFDDFLHLDALGNRQGSSKGASLIVLSPLTAKKGPKFNLNRLLGKGKKTKSMTIAGPATYSPRQSCRTTSQETISTPRAEHDDFPFINAGTPQSPAQVESEPEPEMVEQAECVSCLDEFPIAETIKVPCHHYCADCFLRLITSVCANEQQWPPKCCLNTIPVSTIRAHIPATLATTYDDRVAEWSAPFADRIYCSRRACSLFVPPSRVDRASRLARCTVGHRTCTLCREEAHDGAECPRDRDVELTEALAEEEGWLHCGRCRALVEHREACQHMTCRCGYQFCYVCSAVWQTCRCNMADLARKKAQVLSRREMRMVREAEAEAELQEALRQIAEFEREEALKAELLRQEMERQEEERRQRELEERIQREEVRRGEVEMKFAELREVLADLHALQALLVGHEQSRCAEALDEQARTSKEALGKKHDEKRVELDAQVADKLSIKEAGFLREYDMRVAEERAVEETYRLQLTEFYAGKKGSEGRVKQEMTRLRRQLDKGWRAWSCWRDERLEAYRVSVEEERAIKDELMVSAELRLVERLEQQVMDLEKKKQSDNQWVRLVVAERERMLDEAEAAELDNGDDMASLFAPSDDGSGCA